MGAKSKLSLSRKPGPRQHCALAIPDVHCKGTDYTEATVPEREVMRELGGAVRIVGDGKNHSTRDLLAKILRRSKEPMDH